MNVYALTDGSETMAIYATEAEALVGAQWYIRTRMWHDCRIKRFEIAESEPKFNAAVTLFYEDCGKMVAMKD
jgi:hypothetical protein